MKLNLAFLAGCLAAATALNAQAPQRVLKRSDVAFMYEAGRQTYADYGATVLAWGGRPNPRSLEEARGVKFFGSVGMVTEFAAYYERFPQTYEQGLCRDVNGQPVKVPWLTDHKHKGIPYWWCCTQQPQFRQFLQERVADTVKAGADGVHIDDHLGTSGGLWLGICFCDLCIEGFRAHLKTLAAEELARHGIDNPERFDYRNTLKTWLSGSDQKRRSVQQHPLWPHWTTYQRRAAAAFMKELHELAGTTAGRRIPMGANACLLGPGHLSDCEALDLFSAEIDHHAEQRRVSDLPIAAYRLADAVGRPLASTASGGDWAFIKEHNLPGLVRDWIALSYASGHCLMAPARQWCYTPQKGTHWYDGPKEKFAPLYQFVRRNAALFDDYESHADLGVVLPHGSYVKNPGRWFEICNKLAAANVGYRLFLAGDAVVGIRLDASSMKSCPVLFVADTDDLLPGDRRVVDEVVKEQPVSRSVADALAAARPAVRVTADGTVRALARVKPGSAVIHLLNYDYDSARDDVQPIAKVRVQADLGKLGVPGAQTCRFVTLDGEPVALKVEGGVVEVPQLGLWGILVL